MSSNPYDSFGSPRGLEDMVPPAPGRMSILAVMSLVLSILCVTAPLGLICGGLALITISRSRGRLSGIGMAAAGTIIGLIASVIMLIVAIGMAQVSAMFNSNFTGPVGTAMVAVEKDDVTGLAAMFSTTAAPLVTAERVGDFRTAYQSELGSFTGMPGSVVGYFTSFATIGPLMQRVQTSGIPAVPFAGYFQKGTAAILVLVPQNGSTPPAQGKWLPQYDNIGMITPKGTVIWLLDPPSGMPATVPSDAPTSPRPELAPPPPAAPEPPAKTPPAPAKPEEEKPR